MLTKHFHSKFLREEYLDANKHLAYFKVLGVTTLSWISLADSQNQRKLLMYISIYLKFHIVNKELIKVNVALFHKKNFTKGLSNSKFNFTVCHSIH